jgi:hypothetical protein
MSICNKHILILNMKMQLQKLKLINFIQRMSRFLELEIIEVSKEFWNKKSLSYSGKFKH